MDRFELWDLLRLSYEQFYKIEFTLFDSLGYRRFQILKNGVILKEGRGFNLGDGKFSGIPKFEMMASREKWRFHIFRISQL